MALNFDRTKLAELISRPAIALPTRYDDLSPVDRARVRSHYIWLQDGLCSHCQAPLEEAPRRDVANLSLDVTRFPDNFFETPVHLHHDHVTGLTIGAVHAHCNAVLWQYEGK